MSRPNLRQFQYTYEQDSATIYGSFVVGDLGAVDSFQGGGIESIVLQDPPVAATFTGQVAGMTTDVTLTAVVPGDAGNSIALVGDGTSTLAQLITAWNVANPGNTVSLTSGSGSQILDNAAEIDLADGSDGSLGLYDIVLSSSWNKLMEVQSEVVLATVSGVCNLQILQTNTSVQAAVRARLPISLEAKGFNGNPHTIESGAEVLLRIVLRQASQNAPQG